MKFFNDLIIRKSAKRLSHKRKKKSTTTSNNFLKDVY